jgi:RsiW-degrading membrane proteinase PrsW (M82 family)
LGSVLAFLPRFLLAIPPVFVFLFLLRLSDSFRLVPPDRVLRATAFGCLAAVTCYRIDSLLFTVAAADADWLARVVAPLIEEVLKAAYVLWLIRTARVGFMVDAAICGFAVGAGFSLIENIYYIRALAESSLSVWTLRGFGTAIMHGGTTAIVSVVAIGVPDSTGRK